MSAIQAYSNAVPAPKTAIPVDLTAGDWTTPLAGVLYQTPQPTCAVYVGTAGDLVVAFAADPATPVTLKAHPTGYATIGIVKVIKAGTTAANLVALI